MKNIKTKVIRAYAEVPKGETEVWAIDCTFPRDAKVNKHRMERTKLSTQLGSFSLG